MNSAMRDSCSLIDALMIDWLRAQRGGARRAVVPNSIQPFYQVARKRRRAPISSPRAGEMPGRNRPQGSLGLDLLNAPPVKRYEHLTDGAAVEILDQKRTRISTAAPVFLAGLVFPAIDPKAFSRFSNSSPEAESVSATLSSAAAKPTNTTAPHSSNKCVKCYER